MASQEALMHFPIRTKDKGTSWTSRFDETFPDCPDIVPLENLNPWDDSMQPTSSFDELFEDLLDNSSQQTHSSGTPEIKLLTEPRPAFLDTSDFWTKTLKSLGDTTSQTLPPSAPLSPLTTGTPDDNQHFDYCGCPTPPYAPAATAYVGESTPNMMNQSRYRPSLEEMLGHTQTNAPSVPPIGKEWTTRPPPSTPTSTETDGSFVPAQGLGFDIPGRQTFAHSQDFVNPFLVPVGSAHSSFSPPFVDHHFIDPADHDWISSYNHQAITFNTGTFQTRRLARERRRSFTDMDVPTPPSFNPWTKAHATPPPTLALNPAALRDVPHQAVMSAPILRQGQLGFGFPSDFSTNVIISTQAPPMTGANISPRTNTWPTVVPNFSLPYRKVHSISPRRETRPHPIHPAHQRATSELPMQQGEDLTSRRMRSPSRGRTGRHHRRTKSGPGPSDESSSVARASWRKQAKSGQLAGFVNFTPDDSKKLLTGVAPSGSSKTKAKREKEAMEKRRRLSQAAVKAVREGDLGALREAGLLTEDASRGEYSTKVTSTSSNL